MSEKGIKFNLRNPQTIAKIIAVEK